LFSFAPRALLALHFEGAIGVLPEYFNIVSAILAAWRQ
jgi:hypothetical protein